MSTFGVAGFDTTFLLPTDTLTGALVQAAIVDPVTGFGYNRIPFRTGFRYGLGDVEVAAKYRLLAGAHYAAAVKALVRLPTGARDSADDLLAQPIGDPLLAVHKPLPPLPPALSAFLPSDRTSFAFDLLRFAFATGCQHLPHHVGDILKLLEQSVCLLPLGRAGSMQQQRRAERD